MKAEIRITGMPNSRNEIYWGLAPEGLLNVIHGNNQEVMKYESITAAKNAIRTAYFKLLDQGATRHSDNSALYYDAGKAVLTPIFNG
jgi:hypothetical protein